MTVLADNTTARGISAEDGKSNTASVSLPPEKIMFLDQVSAEIEATVRGDYTRRQNKKRDDYLFTI